MSQQMSTKPRSIIYTSGYAEPILLGGRCNFCNKVITSTFRLKGHMMTACPLTPPDVKEKIKEEGNKENTEKISKTPGAGSRLNVDTLKRNEKEDYDMELSNFFFQSNIPFAVVENSSFKSFVKKLKPAYDPPSRITLATSLLDKHYQKVKTNMETDLEEATTITLMIDGWSNVSREPIINVVACIPRPYFIKSINTGIERHTKDNLVQIVEEQMELLGVDKIKAIVTDNAYNMAAMRKELHDKYPNLIVFGCAAHSFNLMVGDLIKIEEIGNVVKQSNSIVTEIRSSDLMIQKYKDAAPGLKSLKQPVPTRWYSQYNSLKSVSEGKMALVKLAMDEEIKKTEIVNVIRELNGCNFWKPLDDIISIFQPIVEAIGVVERDSSNLSDVMHEIITTKRFIEAFSSDFFAPISHKVLNEIMKRIELMTTPEHYFAYAIDPRYRGHQLDIDELQKVYDFLEKHPLLMPPYQKFDGKTGPFKITYHWLTTNISEPSSWWAPFKRHVELIELVNYAEVLFQIPGSSAAIERNFSNQARIHTKERNKLSLERVGKLLSCQFNSRANNDKKHVRLGQSDDPLYYVSESDDNGDE